MTETKTNIAISIAVLTVTVISGFHLCFAEKSKEQKTPVAVHAEVDRTSVAIGDKIKYTITVSADSATEIEFPDFGKNLGNFAIKDFGSHKKAFFGTQKLIEWYFLDTYVTGDSIIPKVTIKYRVRGRKEWDTVETAEQVIKVKSILDEAGPNTRIRDIKDPVHLPSRLNLYFMSALSGGILAILVFPVFLFRKKRGQKAACIRRAHEIAYELLEALKRKEFIRQGKVKEYYFEISNIVRHYIEHRFHLGAPEMTTEEFLFHVKDYSQLENGHKNLLKEFLICCDLVKFARYAPTVQEIDSAFEAARNFVDQTKECE